MSQFFPFPMAFWAQWETESILTLSPSSNIVHIAAGCLIKRCLGKMFWRVRFNYWQAGTSQNISVPEMKVGLTANGPVFNTCTVLIMTDTMWTKVTLWLADVHIWSVSHISSTGNFAVHTVNVSHSIKMYFILSSTLLKFKQETHISGFLFSYQRNEILNNMNSFEFTVTLSL